MDRDYPNLIHARELRSDENSAQWPDGSWGAVRFLGCPSKARRLTLAWRVFIGRYDAVSWDGTGQE